MILHSVVFLYTTANLQGSKGSIPLEIDEKDREVGKDLFKAASATAGCTGPREGIPTTSLGLCPPVWVPSQ